MLLRDKLLAGFIVPAQPVEREKPPTGPGWILDVQACVVALQGRRTPVLQIASHGIRVEPSYPDGEMIDRASRLSIIDRDQDFCCCRDEQFGSAYPR
jgi:hypothetical protein